MKKNKLWLAALCLAICAFMNISCASAKLAEPEKFQDQSYKLTSINFMSDNSIASKDDALIFFENFPVEALKSALLENYNIELDENIFDKEKLADNLVVLVSKKESGEETILGWSLSDPEVRVENADEIIKKYKKNAQISEEDLAAINEVYNHIATLDVKLFTQMSNTTKGLSMLVNIGKIDFKDYVIAIPAFFVIVLMPLSYSITTGIEFGFMAYAITSLLVKEKKEVSPMIYIFSIFFVIKYVFQAIG